MKNKYYYIIEHKGDTVTIIRNMLPLGPFSILWCNAGMFALIPDALLEVLYEGVANTNTQTQIWWEQACKLPQEVGQLLCDQNYNVG